MTKLITIITLCAVVLATLTVAGSVAAQEREMDPGAVVVAVYEAVQAHDLARAGALLADDAVLVLMPPPPGTDGAFVGKEAVLGWYESLSKNNFAAEFQDAQVSGNRVTITLLGRSDDLPIAPIVFDGTGIVQGGLVKTLSWVMTPETLAKLDAAMAQLASRDLAVRYMEELWNQGELAVVDEIIAEDFVSYSYPIPQGDRAALRESVAAFRAENPNAYFTYDDITVTDDRLLIVSTMMVRPEGAAADVEGEPAGGPMVLILSMKDGKITERWLFTTPE